MRATLLALLALAAAAPTFAQEGQPAGTPLTLERTVQLVGPPVPLLKYDLLPPGGDRTPGNAAVGYLRAATLMPEPPAAAKDRSESVQKRLAWAETPDDKLPVAEVNAELKSHGPYFRALDDAARRRDCDWQHDRDGRDEVAVNYHLLQRHREAAWLLDLRSRGQRADGRQADALRTTQTALQYARHVGEAGSVVELILGHALAGSAIKQAEALTARPGGPNLYWAVATLPRPLIDHRPGLDGELGLTLSYLPKLAELEAGPVTEAAAGTAFRDHMALMSVGNDNYRMFTNPLAQFGQAAGLTLLAPAARDELVKRGRDRAEVEKMPAAQAVLLRGAAIHRDLWDEQVAAFSLPAPQARAQLARVKERSKEVLKDHPNDPTLKVFSLVLPTVVKVHEAAVRTERRLALLQAAEAVRLHAATQSGQLPAALAEVSVPVPADPSTAEPFAFERTPTGYRLTGPAPAGETPNLSNAVTLTVTVAR